MTVAGIVKGVSEYDHHSRCHRHADRSAGLVEALSKALAAHHEPEASCLTGSLLDFISSVASSFMFLHPESLTAALTYMSHKLSRLLLTAKVFHVRRANSVNDFTFVV